MQHITDPAFASHLAGLVRAEYYAPLHAARQAQLQTLDAALAQRQLALGGHDTSATPEAGSSDDGDDDEPGALTIAAPQPLIDAVSLTPPLRKRGRPLGVKNHRVLSEEERELYRKHRRDSKRVSKIRERARGKLAREILAAFELHAGRVARIEPAVLRKVHKLAQQLLECNAPVALSPPFAAFAAQVAAAIAKSG